MLLITNLKFYYFTKTQQFITMKNIILLITAVILSTAVMAQSKSFYDFTVKDIDGKDYSLEQLKGKKVMVVNVASKCGFTYQYEGLQELYKTYRDHNFVIIGFPANNFMKQEPGTDSEIKTFCSTTYGVDFPMMSKISVKGDDIHPLYKWLTNKAENGFEDSKVKWNFQKYLINEEGKLVRIAGTKEEPMSEAITSWIKK